MSLEELMLEHIKALNENTRALVEHTKALNFEAKIVNVEHTKNSACKFCGITYKTLQNYLANADVTPCRRQDGKREFFMESDLVQLCEEKKLYSGEYGLLKTNPTSEYYEG